MGDLKQFKNSKFGLLYKFGEPTRWVTTYTVSGRNWQQFCDVGVPKVGTWYRMGETNGGRV